MNDEISVGSVVIFLITYGISGYVRAVVARSMSVLKHKALGETRLRLCAPVMQLVR